MESASSKMLHQHLAFPDTKAWLRPISDHLKSSVFSRHLFGRSDGADVVFVCRAGRQIFWNGLAYLAANSSLFSGRAPALCPCKEPQAVIVDAFEPGAVRLLLLLISAGEVVAGIDEMKELSALAKAMGLRVRRGIS